MKPAVPIAIACRGVNASGTGTSQSGSTRARCASPPQCRSPIPQPLTSTASPAPNAGSADSVTVPARSMPATIGSVRAIGAVPVIPSASL